MKYADLCCEKCGKTFLNDDDVVVCPVCGAPHHRDCWYAENCCASSEKHGEGYIWVSPVLPEKENTENSEIEDEKKTNRGNPAIFNQNGEAKLSNGEKIIRCPQCGANNCENDMYCMRCGCALNNTTGFTSVTPENEAEYKNNVYMNLDLYGGLSPESEIDGIPVREYSEYIGGKKPGRIIRKLANAERFNRKTIWCWAAFLFGPAWLFFRKLYKEGAVISVVLIAACLASGLLQLTDSYKVYIKETINVCKELVSGEITQEELIARIQEYEKEYAETEEDSTSRTRQIASEILYYIAFPGLPAVCCLGAMMFYKKKLKSDILQSRDECTNMDEYIRSLRLKGGTNTGGAVLGVLVYFVAFFCYTYLPMLIVMSEMV